MSLAHIIGAVGQQQPAGGGAFFEDNWAGTNGDPWNASKWAVAQASNGTIDIQSNAGRLAPGGAGYAAARARADTADIADVDVLVSFTLDSTDESYFGVFARASTTWDANNYGIPNDSYRVEFQHSGGAFAVRIIECTGGTDGILVSATGLTATAAKRWVRFQTTGTTIRARWWADADAEPGTWNLSTTDATRTTGKFGLYHFNGASATARTATVDDLTVTAL